MADAAEYDRTSEHYRSGRKLRNCIILANAIAWVVIALAIRLIF